MKSLNKCSICNKQPLIRPGWFNISDMMYPLCNKHMDEYIEFINGMKAKYK